MSRNEVYIIIKDQGNDFKQAIKDAFGCNYTNVNTEDLLDFINKHLTGAEEEADENENAEADTCECQEPCCEIVTAVAGMLLSLSPQAKCLLNEVISVVSQDEEFQQMRDEAFALAEQRFSKPSTSTKKQGKSK